MSFGKRKRNHSQAKFAIDHDFDNDHNNHHDHDRQYHNNHHHDHDRHGLDSDNLDNVAAYKRNKGQLATNMNRLSESGTAAYPYSTTLQTHHALVNRTLAMTIAARSSNSCSSNDLDTNADDKNIQVSRDDGVFKIGPSNSSTTFDKVEDDGAFKLTTRIGTNDDDDDNDSDDQDHLLNRDR
jgi:hypothetical protein